MPIPDRLRPPPPTAEEMAEYTELCRRIENGRYADDEELAGLLARWNHRAGREFDVDKFHARVLVETEQFVSWMLMGTPQLVSNLTYAELRDVLESLQAGGLSHNEDNYYLRWMHAQLPGCDLFDVANLIYYTDYWLGLDESMLHVELTPEQTIAYAMAWSGRRVPGAPENVPLPYPIPPRTGA